MTPRGAVWSLSGANAMDICVDFIHLLSSLPPLHSGTRIISAFIDDAIRPTSSFLDSASSPRDDHAMESKTFHSPRISDEDSCKADALRIYQDMRIRGISWWGHADGTISMTMLGSSFLEKATTAFDALLQEDDEWLSAVSPPRYDAWCRSMMDHGPPGWGGTGVVKLNYGGRLALRT